MPSNKNIPSLLEPYLRLPREQSLILLTSTLGCSVSWLTARFIGSMLTGNDFSSDVSAEINKTCVIAVSWLRDLNFWKTELKRATGLDASRLASARRFVCVDALTDPKSLSELSHLITSTVQAMTQHHSKADGVAPKIILVLDNPDLCLATASSTAAELSTFLLSVRRQAWATVLTCSAGLPLVSAAVAPPETRSTPIESETAAFIVTQSHCADFVMSVRGLETGAAKDVSGVLRVTRGGSAYSWGTKSTPSDETKEAEMLYLVQRDGSVKAFTRGSEIET